MGESTLSHFPNRRFASPTPRRLRTVPESPSSSLGFYLNSDNNLALQKYDTPFPQSGFSQALLSHHQAMTIERWTW
jgi:hypothetical protein